MKTTLLPSSHNTFETAIELPIDNTHLSPRNSLNKYTLRRHWVETVAVGASKGNSRYCYTTYDSKRAQWCNVKKATSSLYVMLRQYVDQRGNEDIGTLSISRYDSSESIRKTLDTYEMEESQAQELTKLADIKDQVGKIYDDAKESALTEMATNRTKLSDYKFNTPYSIEQITKCTDNIPLIAISVVGTGVKKRCRKSEYFSEILHYILPSPDSTGDSVLALLEDAKDIALSTITDKFRSVSRYTISAKPIDYQAPRELGGFYGMKQSLMEPSLASIPVKVLS